MAEGWSESVPRPRRKLCRNFALGACKWGHSCYYSHDLTMQKSSKICRYYSNGYCCYGDLCRYQHIKPTVRWSSGSRRGSAPALQMMAGESSQSYHGVGSSNRPGGGNRRSSAPAIQRMPAGFSQSSHAVERTVHSTWGRRGSEPAVSRFPHFGRNTECFGMQLEEEEVAEDKTNETPSHCSERWELAAEFIPRQFQEHDCAQTSQAADPFHCMSREACSCGNSPQTDLEKDTSVSQSVTKKKWTENLAIEMSKDIICGICMDKVYEKTPVRDRCFAILPDCNHAFCLACIKKWRLSKGFTNNIIKACPECRIVSNYFIPHRYWVVDEQKQMLIDKFKAEKRKIRCKFFLQSNGRCPFKSECIYLHEFPEGYRPPRHQPRRRSNPPPLGIMWEDDDYDDDDDCDEDDYDHTLRLLGILSLDDSFLESLVHFQYELSDSDLSDFNDSSSDD